MTIIGRYVQKGSEILYTAALPFIDLANEATHTCQWLGRMVDEIIIEQYCPKRWQDIARKVYASVFDIFLWGSFFLGMAQIPCYAFCCVRVIVLVVASFKSSSHNLPQSSYKSAFTSLSKYACDMIERQGWAIACCAAVAAVAYTIFSVVAKNELSSVMYLTGAIGCIPVAYWMPLIGKQCAQISHRVLNWTGDKLFNKKGVQTAGLHNTEKAILV